MNQLSPHNHLKLIHKNLILNYTIILIMMFKNSTMIFLHFQVIKREVESILNIYQAD